MKKLLILSIANLVFIAGFSQMPLVNYSNTQDSLVMTVLEMNTNMNSVWGNKDPNYNYTSQPLDSNSEYRRINNGLIMQGGELKIVRNGFLFRMRGPVPLKNGAMVYANGIIKMPDGATPLLDEKEYIDFDGHIRLLEALNFSPAN